MLTIRAAQMQVFSEAAQRLFEMHMLGYLRSSYAHFIEKRSDPEVLSVISQGIAEGEAHDIVSQADVARYIGYLVTYGPDFGTQPWAAAILRDPHLDSTQKMDRIDDFDLFAGRGGLS